MLLVDDEPEILRLFVRMLSQVDRPLTILQAQNGRRARASVQARGQGRDQVPGRL